VLLTDSGILSDASAVVEPGCTWRVEDRAVGA